MVVGRGGEVEGECVVGGQGGGEEEAESGDGFGEGDVDVEDGVGALEVGDGWLAGDDQGEGDAHFINIYFFRSLSKAF